MNWEEYVCEEYTQEVRDKFFIVINDITKDVVLATLLGLDYEEYENILIRHHATKLSNGYWFDSKKDAIRAVEELSPYILMLKLRGEIN